MPEDFSFDGYYLVPQDDASISESFSFDGYYIVPQNNDPISEEDMDHFVPWLLGKYDSLELAVPMSARHMAITEPYAITTHNPDWKY